MQLIAHSVSTDGFDYSIYIDLQNFLDPSKVREIIMMTKNAVY